MGEAFYFGLEASWPYFGSSCGLILTLVGLLSRQPASGLCRPWRIWTNRGKGSVGSRCCFPGRVAVCCAWSVWTSRVTQLGPRLDQTSPRGFPPWSGRSAPAWCGPLVRGGAPTVLSAACRLLHPWRIYCVRSGSPPAAGDPPA